MGLLKTALAVVGIATIAYFAYQIPACQHSEEKYEQVAPKDKIYPLTSGQKEFEFEKLKEQLELLIEDGKTELKSFYRKEKSQTQDRLSCISECLSR